MNPLASMNMPASNIGNIISLVKMMQGKDPNMIMQMMAQKNPQFAEFAKNCQGKTPEQVAQEYGVDITSVKNILR